MLVGRSTPPPATLDELLGPGLAARLDRLDLLSRKILAGKLPGERRSKRRGRSVEFDDYRHYVPGDDLRHVDWNVYARFEKLFVKLFREEEDLALHLIVDRSASMEGGSVDGTTKLAYAHRLAMALGYVGLVNQNRVSAAVFGAPGGPRVRHLAPLRGRTSLNRLSVFLLGSLRERGGAVPEAPDFGAAMRTVARGRAGRGIVVLISDLLVPGEGDAPAYGPGLNALAASESGAFDTYCVQVLTPEEIDPRRAGTGVLAGDLRLTDVESGRAAEVTVSSALIARYRRNAEAYLARLKRECAARGIAHVLVPTDTPIDALVLQSLRRGGLVR
ncbi:MAG: DUF58 domain-containing protein [Phycisphaerae bacterium]|nr:DUF58 domain-containing protein [Phycisphaerae bacterium]